jgi:hypothetical protein
MGDNRIGSSSGFPSNAIFNSNSIQTNVALDGNPEPDLVHATGCFKNFKNRIGIENLIKEKQLAIVRPCRGSG